MSNLFGKFTDTLSEGFDHFDNSVKAVSSNKYVHTYIAPVVALLLVLWIVMAAPKLPKSVVQFFDYPVVKIIYMFLIVYIATHNPSVAIVATVALLVMLQTLSSYETAEKLIPAATTTPTLMANLAQSVNNSKEAATIAVNKGQMELAQAFATDAAKIEATIDALVKADAHAAAASNALNAGDKALAQAHAIESSKYNNTAKILNVVQPTPTPMQSQPMQSQPVQYACGSSACSEQIQQQYDDDINSYPDVSGYNEMRGNEDYGQANTGNDINLSYDGPVRPGREYFDGEGEVVQEEVVPEEEVVVQEEVVTTEEETAIPVATPTPTPELFMNLDAMMSVNNEFNDPRAELGCKVGGVRKYRGEDLNNYAPFKLYGTYDKGKRGIRNTRGQKEGFLNENPAPAGDFEIAVGIPSDIRKDRNEEHTVFASHDDVDYASFYEPTQAPTQAPTKSSKK